jgi:hypothetical protein
VRRSKGCAEFGVDARCKVKADAIPELIRDPFKMYLDVRQEDGR